jgi:HSP20 family protein
MITLPVPQRALHNTFRGENTVDLRDRAHYGAGSEAVWLLVPVTAVANKTFTKQVADNVLSINGERKYEKTEGEKNGQKPHCVERYHGTFSRSVVLPTAVMQDKIDAQYRDGVLTVTLPTAEEAKPREITIKT